MASSNDWLPLTGKHPVIAGSTLKKALNGGDSAAKSKFDRNFFAFRYNFKPLSIDTTKPAPIHITRGQENTTVQVEFPDTPTVQANGTVEPTLYHSFKGSETAAKEWDCVLIWDPETQTLALEKVESFVNLTREGKVSAPSGPSSSSVPPVASSSSRKSEKRPIDRIDDVERALLSTLEPEEEGEVTESIRDHRARPKHEEDEDMPLAKTLKSKLPARPPAQRPQSGTVKLPLKPREAVPRYKQPLVAKQRKEAAAAAAVAAAPPVPAPLALPSSSGPVSGPLPPPANSSKSKQKQKATNAQSPHTSAQASKQKPSKTAPPISSAPPTTSTTGSLKRSKLGLEPGAEEERLDFGKSSKPTKRARHADIATSSTNVPPPPKPEPMVLALPGASSNFAPPPAPVPVTKLARSVVTNVTPTVTTTAGSNAAALGLGDYGEPSGGGPEPGSESEDEDGGWDEVEPTPEAVLDDGGVPLSGMLSEGLIEVNGDDIFSGGEGGDEEIDLAFEREMDQQMNEEDDGDDGLGLFHLEVVGDSDGEGDDDMEIMEPEGEVDGDGDMEDFLEAEFEEALPRPPTGQPISLKQWAKGGGGEDGNSDYESSSSEEESDDD